MDLDPKDFNNSNLQIAQDGNSRKSELPQTFKSFGEGVDVEKMDEDEDEDDDDDDDDSQIELTDNMYADDDLSAEGGPVDKYFEKSNFIREFDKDDSTSTQRERAQRKKNLLKSVNRSLKRDGVLSKTKSDFQSTRKSD